MLIGALPPRRGLHRRPLLPPPPPSPTSRCSEATSAPPTRRAPTRASVPAAESHGRQTRSSGRPWSATRCGGRRLPPTHSRLSLNTRPPPPSPPLPHECMQSAQGHVTIPGVQYGQGGAFGVVFWARSADAAEPPSSSPLDGGRGLRYVYSHVNALDRNFAFDPNEVGSCQGRARVSSVAGLGPSCRRDTLNAPHHRPPPAGGRLLSRARQPQRRRGQSHGARLH